MRMRTIVAVALLVGGSTLLAQPAKRPMTFMDQRAMRNAGALALSPDGKQAVYTISTPDWKADRSQTDLYLVSLAQGLPSTRQLTFTKDKNEGPAVWTRDGAIVFASDRDAPPAGANAAGGGRGGAGGGGGGRGGGGGGPAGAGGGNNQLYLLRLDGGEARKITEGPAIGQFQFTRDFAWLIYSAGRGEAQQLYALAGNALNNVAGLAGGAPTQLTHHPTPVRNWQISKVSKTVFFLSPDHVDKDDQARKDQKFGVDIRNPVEPRLELWSLDLGTKTTKQLT